MNEKTDSELIFEEFCQENGLSFQKIIEGSEPTPDYQIIIRGKTVFVEIKQIDEDINFSSSVSTRVPGSHIREKINQARNQIRTVSHNGFPTILLVYNNLDRMQLFGTEQHDFLAAMYGDYTFHISRKTGLASEVFHGRNKAFREDKNSTFSAVGHLSTGLTGINVHIYENIHSKCPLDYDLLPPCIHFSRIQ